MKKPKTLVILTPGFPEDESATHWVPSQQLFVKALKREYPELKIIVLTFLYPYHSHPYQWNDITVIPFDGMRWRKGRRPLLWLAVWKALNKIRREADMLGLFSFWCGECAFLGKYFGKWHRIRHYCWISGQDARRENPFIRLIRPCAEELVAMSPFLREEFQRNHGVRPAHLIPNAIEPVSESQFAGRKDSCTSPVRDVDILGVGSFEPLKQYDLFTTIVQLLRISLPSIRVLHCGVGPGRTQIQELIDRYLLQDNFQLLGGRPHEEVLQLMQRTKIFMHTSRYEGYSTVCLEAIYAGAHVISFCDPLSGKVPQWHVVRDASEMIAKALELLQDPQLEHRSVLLHSMGDTAKSVIELYEKAV